MSIDTPKPSSENKLNQDSATPAEIRDIWHQEYQPETEGEDDNENLTSDQGSKKKSKGSEGITQERKVPFTEKHLNTRAKKVGALLLGATVFIGGPTAGAMTIANNASHGADQDTGKTNASDPLATEQATTTPTPEVSPSDLPSSFTTPTPSEAPTTAKAETTAQAPDKYTLDELKSMPSAQFNKLDFKDKAKYIKFLLEDSNDRLMFYSTTKADLYKYNPLDVASESNSAQEVIMQLWYEVQLPFGQPKTDAVGDYSLDTEKANKALSAGFYSTNETGSPPTYYFMKQGIDNGETAGEIKDVYTNAKDIKPVTEEVDANGKTIKVRTISFLDNGVEHIMKLTLRKLDDESSIWQVYEERK